MTNRLRQFIRLPLAEKLMLVRAFWLLTVVHQGLRHTSFSRLRSWAEGRNPAGSEQSFQQLEAEWIDRVGWSVNAAANHHILKMQCLERSLVLQRLLTSRGVPALFRIGVNKEGDDIRAHAWLEVNGQAICEAEEIDARFRLLVSSRTFVEM